MARACILRFRELSGMLLWLEEVCFVMLLLHGQKDIRTDVFLSCGRPHAQALLLKHLHLAVVREMVSIGQARKGT